MSQLPSVSVFQPLCIGGGVRRYIGPLMPDGGGFILTAFGGCWEAPLQFGADWLDAQDWLMNGLGRHIEIPGAHGPVAWDGFVDQVEVAHGALSVVRGPLLGIANRVRVMYSPLDTSVTPPATGVRTPTPDADDADSQAWYGIIPAVLSQSDVSAADALVIRDAYLGVHSLPKITKSWAYGGSQPTTVSLSCKGYIHWLNYPYASTTAGDENASARIANILAACPNTWLTWDTTYLDANTLQVPAWEGEASLALDAIRDVVAKGDAPGYRWTFGVYPGLQVRYEQVGLVARLSYYQSGATGRIEDVNHNEVYPWEVLPAKWLLFADLFTNQPQLVEYIPTDPRTMFVEQMTYTIPYGLELLGGTADKLPQILAQYGLAGTNA